MPLPPALSSQHLTYWKERIGRIQPNAPRQFGSLEPVHMLAHLRRILEPALGDFQAPDDSNVLTRLAIVRYLLLHMPWPKGKIKAPDWVLIQETGAFDEERRRLFETMDRFAALHAQDPQAKIRNPLFGPVPLEYLSRLQGKHFDHHARQFGV